MSTEENKPPRVLIVVGTRPEAIKMAPVVDAFRKDGRTDARVALTGQHTDLVDQVLDAFSMNPSFSLGIMRPGQSLYDVAAGCLDGLREVVQEFRPDVVLVQGDTATVFFGALVAFFEKIRVGHVEAGLRSGDKWAPFPEEVFRRLTDVLTDYYFAPTQRSADNLIHEGVPSERVHVTGNTVVDALLSASDTEWTVSDATLQSVIEGPNRLVLLTAHRRESFGEPLVEVFRAVRSLVDANQDVEVVYPVHPNPNVTAPAQEILGSHPRIHLTNPLGYTDLVKALQHAELVLTDSGGIQEEAPTFGTPVLVLREVTERPEGVEAGVVRLVGTDGLLIAHEAQAALDRTGGWKDAGTRSNPYGDGKAGLRIADIVVSDLLGTSRTSSDWDGS